jgi:hypothetical protein
MLLLFIPNIDTVEMAYIQTYFLHYPPILLSEPVENKELLERIEEIMTEEGYHPE